MGVWRCEQMLLQMPTGERYAQEPFPFVHLASSKGGAPLTVAGVRHYPDAFDATLGRSIAPRHCLSTERIFLNIAKIHVSGSCFGRRCQHQACPWHPARGWQWSQSFPGSLPSCCEPRAGGLQQQLWKPGLLRGPFQRHSPHVIDNLRRQSHEKTCL